MTKPPWPMLWLTPVTTHIEGVSPVTKRTTLAFWTAVAVAVFLVDGGVSSFRELLGGGGARDVALLVVAAVGSAAALFVPGRIVFVTARHQRRADKH